MKKILLLAFIAFATFSCDDKDEVTPVVPEPKKSITAIAAANPDLSTLVKLLKRTGLDKTLDGAGTYTVFAPTNSSFNSFASESAIASLPDETVKNLLLNHVLVVKKKSTDLKTEYVNTLATGPGGKYLSLYVDLVTNKDKVTLNGKVKVSSPNIEASNGIIHVVDGVLTLPTLVDAAIANPNLSTLVATLTNTAQANTLKVLQDAKTSTPLTLFALTATSISGNLYLICAGSSPISLVKGFWEAISIPFDFLL